MIIKKYKSDKLFISAFYCLYKNWMWNQCRSHVYLKNDQETVLNQMLNFSYKYIDTGKNHINKWMKRLKKIVEIYMEKFPEVYRYV